MKYIIDAEWQARGHDYKASSHTVNELLGLKPKQKLPVEGMPARSIQGITIWVEPLDTSYRGHKRSTHRVKAKCACGRVLSVGRLHQHICK